MTAVVEALYVAPYDSAPMEPQTAVDVVDGGLAGDRYQTGRGYYSPFDVCEVTLVEAEALEAIRDEVGIDLTDGRHRRNVVTRGVTVHDLLDTTFRIGTATLRGTRPRPPCAHVEAVADEEGVARALRGTRGGICADVVTAGEIAVGDDIAVVEADPRTVGRTIVDRLRRSR